MISTRNIDHGVNYVLLSPYAGGGESVLKKSKAISIDEALNNTVRDIPGGEYVMNAKIYITNKHTYAVEGDVWGIAGKNTQRGFAIGDHVVYKTATTFQPTDKTAVITELKGFDVCIVRDDATGQLKEVQIANLKKAGDVAAHVQPVPNVSTVVKTVNGYSVGEHVQYSLWGKIYNGGIITDIKGKDYFVKDDADFKVHTVQLKYLRKDVK